MYFAVKEVIPLNNYLLHIKFKNGKEKIFDMKPYMDTGIFKTLKNEAVFKTAKVSFDTVEWDNEADIDPETLYQEGVDIKK